MRFGYFFILFLILFLPTPAPADPDMNGPGGGEERIAGQPAAPMLIPDINFKETDLLNVFEILSAKTGIMIETQGAPDTPVTLSLQNIDFWQVLFFLVKKHGLAYAVEDDGRVRVFPAADYEEQYGHAFAPDTAVEIIKLKYHQADRVAGNLVRLQSLAGHIFIDQDNRQLILVDRPDTISQMLTLIRSTDTPVLIKKAFHLNYRKPEQVFGKLSLEITPEVGQLEYGEDGASLNVTDTPERMARIETVIASLDQKVEMKFRIQILRIKLNEEHQDGIDWEAIVSHYVSLPMYAEKPSGEPEEARLSLGTITLEDLPVLKDALEAAGQVTDINESKAVATVSRGTDWAFDTLNVPEPYRDPEGFAMTVDVTPDILEDSSCVIRLAPHLRWLSDNHPTIKHAGPDPFAPQKAVKIRLDRRDVVTIGGLLREEEIETTSKFPLLGDLPFLGFIFRSENRLIYRTEYIIFMIPEQDQGAS